MARHPEQVRTLVAHEPPSVQVLQDREEAMATCEAIHETYLREGFGPAMAKFIAFVSHEGPSRPASLTSPLRTPPTSGCRPRTTAPATTRSSG